MTTQAEAFVAAQLGPAAACPPSDAAAARMRDLLLNRPIKNTLDTGAQASARNVPGKWPHAYCLYHGVFTAEEVEPRFLEWAEFERDKRGLGSGGLYASPITHVYKATHFTNTQHACIGAQSAVSATRKLSMKQLVELRKFAVEDDVVDTPDWVGPSRALGWTADGLTLDYMATADVTAFHAAMVLALKLSPDGEKNGVPFAWQNPNAAKDPNHVYVCSPWMDGTNLRPTSRIYKWTGDQAVKARLLHLLQCLAYAQKPDGTFNNDYGWNADGSPGFHEIQGESTETFIWPGLHEAKDALDDEWPSWAETMLNGCKSRYMALDRFRPSNSGFTDFTNIGIAIACAPAWGWRT